jgi:hypothetical protein
MTLGAIMGGGCSRMRLKLICAELTEAARFVNGLGTPQALTQGYVYTTCTIPRMLSAALVAECLIPSHF